MALDSSTDLDISIDSICEYDAEVKSEPESYTNENEFSRDDGVVDLKHMKTEKFEDFLPPEVQFYGNDMSTSCDGCKQKAIEIQTLEGKYKALKKSYVKLSVHFSDLYMKYSDLLKAATNTEDSDIADEVVSIDDVFTLDEITHLQSIPLDKMKDSTFILQCLQYAYKSNTSVLQYKSLKGVPESTVMNDDGTQEHHPAKEPLTPKKVRRIQELFTERLTKCKTSSVGYGERTKQTNINKLIASGIKNVAKRQK